MNSENITDTRLERDRQRRIKYLRRYREDGRAGEAVKRYRQRMNSGRVLCPCGNVAVSFAENSPVCARCLDIERRVDQWAREAQGVEDITQYQQ